MTRLRTAWTTAIFIIFAAAVFAAPPAATEVAPRKGDVVEWYTLKPTDTLIGLTVRYLGDPELWQENFRLNPQIKDPHKLTPGSRIRIIVAREKPKALINKVAQKVEQKPDPNPWMSAQRGAFLKEKDGVRTFENSSAELRFEDGSNVVMTENSLLFVKQMERRRHSSVDEIEIIDGQIDLDGSKTTKPANVNVVIGSVSVSNAISAKNPLAARSRKSNDARAQVMVYNGESDVSSAGAKVAVSKGMGTNVTPGKPPDPPQKLLPAPQINAPAYGEFQRDVPFSWSAVSGAASYVVEIFRDEKGTDLVEKVTGLQEPKWTPTGELPPHDMFWRATAVSPSGLDGYPSKMTKIPAKLEETM